jgi:hypothetical protein
MRKQICKKRAKVGSMKGKEEGGTKGRGESGLQINRGKVG